MYSNPAIKHAIKKPINMHIINSIVFVNIVSKNCLCIYIRRNWCECVIVLTSLFLWKFPMFANVIAQVTSVEHIHYQVQILSVLEGVVHINNEWVVQLSQDLPLVHYWLNGTLCYYTSLRHFFHRILLLGLLSLYFPYFAKSTFTNAI